MRARVGGVGGNAAAYSLRFGRSLTWASSLAVAVGGGLVDRKCPFTLLRVSGTPAGVLSRVVLMEAAVPLVAATVLAAGIACGTSILAFVRPRRPGQRSLSSGPTTTR